MQAKKFFKKYRLNKAGQATVEMVLIASLLTASSYLVLNKFKDPNFKNPLVQFVSGPWQALAGMIESGNWNKRNPSICGPACQNHPDQDSKRWSAEGTTP